MPENAPNAKGPAPIKLPPEQSEAKWVTVHAGLKTAEVTDLELVPASDVKPEDVGTLSLRHVDGVPQLVISGGTYIPAELTVVDGASKPVARYSMGPFALFEIPADEPNRRR
ncbi:hypothetical protein ACFV8T_29165 [Streptomyces sp. NPDC059832]|uniref:hypothetical protein n=1 Tax=unclassified Streptomyces TaxID=2593676 RepID=UPI00365D12F2